MDATKTATEHAGPIAANYFAVIPADVRYDKRLSANEKLLYGEITCLTLAEGYCWATDKALAESFSVGGHTVNEKTVSRWVSHLKKCGHLQTQILTKNGMISGRRIYLKTALPALPEKVEIGTPESTSPYPQKCGDVPAKMRKTYPHFCGTEKENTGKEKERAVPLFDAIVNQFPNRTDGTARELEDSVNSFISMRKAKRSPLTTKRATDAIAKKILEFSNGDINAAISILDQSTERSWTTVFPLKTVTQAPPMSAPPQGELW